MAYLKFCNTETLHKCIVLPENNIVTLIFDNEIIKNFDGFDLFNDEKGKVDIGEDYYHTFNTLYRDEFSEPLNGYQLSNDGSIYVAPEPIPDPEPYEPTLDEIRKQKISEMSSICTSLIDNGVSLKDNTYSYKSEDRSSIKTAVEMAVATGLDVMWHPNDNGCRLFTMAEIVELYVAEETNLTHHTTYFNQMKMFILEETDKEKILVLEYGDELVGTYLETYNTMMMQAQAIVTAYLGKIGAIK